MKKRLQEIEEEAGALREMQAKVEKEMGATQGFFQTSFTFEMFDFQWWNLWIYMFFLDTITVRSLGNEIFKLIGTPCEIWEFNCRILLC